MWHIDAVADAWQNINQYNIAYIVFVLMFQARRIATAVLYSVSVVVVQIDGW